MKKLFAVGLAVGAGVTSMTVFAPAADAAGCVRSYITTGRQGPGTVVKKAAGTGCRDLNLVRANDADGHTVDKYAGYYRTSNGVWHVGTRGYIEVWNSGSYDLSPWVVLVSDVSSGTPMTVASYYDGSDSVTIAH